MLLRSVPFPSPVVGAFLLANPNLLELDGVAGGIGNAQFGLLQAAVLENVALKKKHEKK